MTMEQTEFTFPDEVEEKQSRLGSKVVAPEPEEPEIEVVDDTPEADRNRKPMEEPPKDVTDEELSKYDSILLGAIGHPDVAPGILGRGLLLQMRFDFDQYINLRPARPFDGSLAITNLFTGRKETSAQNKKCSKILTDAGLPGIDNSYPNADAAAICDYFFIMVNLAESVGPDLTRAKWAQASQTRNTFEGAYVPASTFGPNRTNGGDLVHTLVWRADCTCYRSTSPLRRGAG